MSYGPVTHRMHHTEGTLGPVLRRQRPTTIPSEQQLIDVILFNTELDMLHYRIALHDEFVKEFVIVESSLTFSGEHKRLYAKENLTDHKLKHKITLIDVPLDKTAGAWEREHAVRAHVLTWLSNRPKENVLISDVDELMDVDALSSINMPSIDCIRPKLRFYYYCLSCKRGNWSMQSLFRTDGSWYRETLISKGYKDIRGACEESHALMGWHVSYALSTRKIIEKMQSFSHHEDSFVRKLVDNPERESIIRQRVEMCVDIYDRAISPSPQVDEKVPKLRGLPSNEYCLRLS
eukprot:CAMPEP_0179719136 /NCGR_PEP_ID=MMETSP0938-20121108/3271_1 /TAXON_ID=548131 ORGANISM="Ostreococcus mediterraneus, Strain clade-D-RCC1107" /NCGR_SAMPLE_ID=MMETSP0938 /ASSEMBLY_ACC=CAM_ASM_000576 /LENGTH=290 /DNA_ID=CAMNT_0021592965 /DNA_START=247 /DNA_END=1119 /DNA_ORIENTATION=+